jgi:glutathione S-transferase
MSLPIVYSFRRCPYAIRARLALTYANISYELREVSLKAKPQQMLAISPKGTTPVIQIGEGQNAIILEESLDIMNWALQQHDPNGWANLPMESIAIAKQLITTNDREFKQSLDRYKYPNRFPEYPQEFYRQQAEQFLQVLESQLQQHLKPTSQVSFLICDRQTLADAAIFPFIRQFAYVDINWFHTSPYPHLQRWLQWHEASSLFEFVMLKYPVWTEDQEMVVIKPCQAI